MIMNPVLAEDVKYIANNLENEIAHLKNSSIYITGGTGYFGKNILEAVLYLNEQRQLNIKLFILTRNKQFFLSQHPRFNHPSFFYIEGNVNDFWESPEHIDYIIHGAGEAAKLGQTDELEILETAYSGTKNLLEFAKTKKVKSFLYLSSGGVYGTQPYDLRHTPESYTGSPDISGLEACYGEGKRKAEYLCLYYGKKFQVPVKIARCFAFVGPYMPLDAHFACGNFIKNALQNESIVIKSDGSSVRSFLYTADLVSWLFKTLLHGQNLVPYNIGATQEISILELAGFISKSFNHSINIEVLQKEKVKNPARYVPDNARIIKDLNITSFIPLEKSLQQTIEYYKFEYLNKRKI